MVYQSVLTELCQSVSGARGAAMLDSGGEIVVETHKGDEWLRLVGAYQAIALASAARTAERYGSGPIRHLVSRYAGGTIITHPLNDGYFLVLALGPEGSVPLAVHRSVAAGERLNAEI